MTLDQYNRIISREPYLSDPGRALSLALRVQGISEVYRCLLMEDVGARVRASAMMAEERAAAARAMAMEEEERLALIRAKAMRRDADAAMKRAARERQQPQQAKRLITVKARSRKAAVEELIRRSQEG
jgi:hypothetical protein